MTSRFLKLSNLSKKNHFKKFHTTTKLKKFHESDRKGGFPFLLEDYTPKMPQNFTGKIKQACVNVFHELNLFKDETIENFRMDPPLCLLPGEVDVQWKFDGDPDILNHWSVTSDKDYNLGYSTAQLELTPSGTGLFSGVLDTRPIKDGKQKQGGYCNLRSQKVRQSFYREDTLPWGSYTHLIMRIRGDGRTYMLNLHPKNTFDIMWNDLHSFVLYTRGGPYWQYAKIPFSRFLLANKGRVQDTQGPVPIHNLSSFSITVGDQISGPFRLEIDYIGLEQDNVFEEEFAYEMYKPPNPYYD
ncbi:complex I intermediate-associated protein 30, mitochondrial [Microplitis demolitor]|uniref:complex I intermediate-associated protein 30, mitochondrial n=1 Tax=Microplitis demolitor TaxID=69319 RepID=UPI00235B634F|nr:complex I intermediate-associated protein 30, mitochondrial [Microplitis demolitor]